MEDDLRAATRRVVQADERWRDAVGSWFSDEDLTVNATTLEEIERLSHERHDAEREWITALRRRSSQRVRRGGAASGHVDTR